MPILTIFSYKGCSLYHEFYTICHDLKDKYDNTLIIKDFDYITEYDYYINNKYNFDQYILHNILGKIGNINQFIQWAIKTYNYKDPRIIDGYNQLKYNYEIQANNQLYISYMNLKKKKIHLLNYILIKIKN